MPDSNAKYPINRFPFQETSGFGLFFAIPGPSFRPGYFAGGMVCPSMHTLSLTHEITGWALAGPYLTALFIGLAGSQALSLMAAPLIQVLTLWLQYHAQTAA